MVDTIQKGQKLTYIKTPVIGKVPTIKEILEAVNNTQPRCKNKPMWEQLLRRDDEVRK